MKVFYSGQKGQAAECCPAGFSAEIWFRISIRLQFYSKAELNPLPGSSGKYWAEKLRSVARSAASEGREGREDVPSPHFSEYEKKKKDRLPATKMANVVPHGGACAEVRSL